VNPVVAYVSKLAEIRSSGHATNETSYYPAIDILLNEVGKSLKPRVRAILQLKNHGAGQPDGGLFTQDQFKKGIDPKDLDFTVQPPNRGALEVKGLAEDLKQIVKSDQVTKYLKAYGQVLVTNYREFRIVIPGKDGKPFTLEGYSIADKEDAFWAAADHSHKTAAQHGTHLIEFLTRALLSSVTISSPQHLAGFLASYARDALAKVEARAHLKELEQVRKALEEALGLKFTDEKGEHFFRSTLVQTLFYGLFSAWVLWCREPDRQNTDRFDWKGAVWSLQVPMIRALYERIASPGHLEPLGLVSLLDLTGEILNRVDRDAFFLSFEEGTAVQYFYEPFLEAYDPKLRKQFGVWYTPREIVRYMVERVDRVLRTELKLTAGLADSSVYVLDPACGTGAYLVEVLDRIHRTICEQQGEDILTPQKIKSAARDRIFGFEILPAPFVISHLQLGLLLQRYGAPLTTHEGKRERVGVYLTNSLTGWEPPDETKAKLPFPEFEQEKEEADKVKHKETILVVLGNPPYDGFAGVSPVEEQGLVEPYKEGLSEVWGIKKYNLDDLYVRFFRLAERRIAEQSKKRGIVCFISNTSWVREASFVVMRKHLFDSFQKIWVENLHGNRKISEYAPDGSTSETIFAVAGFSPGIQQGVATTLWVKTSESPGCEVFFRDDFNAAKAADRRASMLKALENSDFQSRYLKADPGPENRYSFKPYQVSVEYRSWPRILDLCAEPPSNGLMEKRSGALIDIDRTALEQRMKAYFDPNVDWDAYRLASNVLTADRARFNAKKARAKAIEEEKFQDPRLVRYAMRPFDTRWCYYTGVRPVWNEPRPKLWKQVFPGNSFLLTRFRSTAVPEGLPVSYTSLLSDDHYMIPDGVGVPFELPAAGSTKKASSKKNKNQLSAFEHQPEVLLGTVPNISNKVNEWASQIGITEISKLLWLHVLAVCCSPAYLAENMDGVLADWPRVPLPNSKELLEASAKVGQRVAALLDTENDVEHVVAGNLPTWLKITGQLQKVDGQPLNEVEDLKVTAGWGHPGKGGVTMPGQGKALERERTPVEIESLLGSKSVINNAALHNALGATTYDVYLNDGCFWKNVPAKVWEFFIGGYQVIKKWLSYRELEFLCRPLTTREADEVTAMIRRLTALCLMQTELDSNYFSVKGASYVWPQPAPVTLGLAVEEEVRD
jgi:hypothetical protein